MDTEPIVPPTITQVSHARQRSGGGRVRAKTDRGDRGRRVFAAETRDTTRRTMTSASVCAMRMIRWVELFVVLTQHRESGNGKRKDKKRHRTANPLAAVGTGSGSRIDHKCAQKLLDACLVVLGHVQRCTPLERTADDQMVELFVVLTDRNKKRQKGRGTEQKARRKERDRDGRVHQSIARSP